MRKMSLVLALSLAHTVALGATRTVTTVDNANSDPGQLSLLQAIQQLQDGDTIAFNLPGGGPHVIVTPEAGYPIITANNVTIDGYTQPGAVANSNGILAGNNAQIKIVLDSSAGPGQRTPLGPLNNPGFGASESAIIAVQGGDNFKARGLSFLSRFTQDTDTDPVIYCFAFIDEALNAHISGCWFGLHPDATTISGGRASVASFRGLNGINSSGLVIGTNGDGQNDRAEFNIHTQMGLAIHLETPNVRVSGNYINVMPDGVTFVDLTTDAFEHEAIENGFGLNMLIGTNGDGVSDEEERNIIGPLNYSRIAEFWRPGAEGIIFAGNYVGVNATGSATAPNGVAPAIPSTLLHLRKNSSARIGSNFDGVSDAIEGNKIYGLAANQLINWHGGNADPNGTGTEATEVVFRGNELVGNAFVNPPLQGLPVALSLSEYFQFVLADAATTTEFAPVFSNNGEQLTGTIPARNLTEYPHAFVDFYVVDAAAFGAGRLNPGRLVGTVQDNGENDSNPAAHQFTVNLTAFNLTRRSVLIAAVTYSKDSAKTEVARAVTSPFSAAIGAGKTVAVVPAGGGAPGDYPTTSVTAANWTAAGGTTYDSTVAVDLLEQGPIPWAVSKYNRGDFSVKLSPFDATAARANLNKGFIDFNNSDATSGPGRSWSPIPDVGILIPTVRELGPTDYNDTQGAFYGTIAAGGFASGNGYDMNTGAFGAGGVDVQTGKAGAATEGNVNFSTAWFPYDLGFTGGVIGYDPQSVEGAQWAGAMAHSPNLSSATIMQWAGTGGYGTLTIPGATSTEGLLFATSADGQSHVNIVTAAPNGAGGWIIGVREDDATDPLAFAVPDQNEFAFVYIPYTAINFVGGLVDGDTGSRVSGSENFTVSRVSTGRYEITIPGKTGATGSLILQNADTLSTDPLLPDNNFLAYEFINGKFVVEARHTTAAGTALEDTDFAFAYIDFTNPVRITEAPSTDIEITATYNGDGTLTLSWTGNAPRYNVYKKVNVTDATWMPLLTTEATSERFTTDGMTGFFRVEGVTDPAAPNIISMTSLLSPEAERPAVTGSTASGLGVVSIVGNTLHYLVTYSGFRSVPSNAHIHGTATSDSATSVGVVAGIAVPTNREGYVQGTINLTEAQKSIITGGHSYFNIHSPEATGGEIRGMILHRKYETALTGATAATGNATVTIVGNQLHYDVSWANLSSQASNAHIHGPTDAAGTGNAGPAPGGQFPEFPSLRGTTDRITGILTLSNAQAATTLGAIIDGKAYINIHSVTNPGGEIRGFLAPHIP